jgi:hypothetical protein
LADGAGDGVEVVLVAQGGGDEVQEAGDEDDLAVGSAEQVLGLAVAGVGVGAEEVDAGGE